MKKDTFCTEKEHWEDGEKAERRVAKRLAFGRVCHKTVLQIMEEGVHFSTPQQVCQGVLFRKPKEFNKKEWKAFIGACDIARAKYDRLMNHMLLEDNRFHQNAKIIVLLRSIETAESGDADSKTKLPTYEVHTVVRKKDE